MAKVSRVRHPALAAVQASGREDARIVWFRRQDPGGLGLGQLARLGNLEPRRAVVAVTTALEGVAALHRAEVVHGGLGADAIRVLGDGRVVIVAPPPTLPRGSGKHADIRALGRVLSELAGEDAGPVAAAIAEGRIGDAETAAWALKGAPALTAPPRSPRSQARVRSPRPQPRTRPARRSWPKPVVPARVVLGAAAAALVIVALVATPVRSLPSRIAAASSHVSFSFPSTGPKAARTATPPPLPRSGGAAVAPSPVPSAVPSPVEPSAPATPPPPAVAAAPAPPAVVMPPVPAPAAPPAPVVARAPADVGPPAAVARFYALVSAHDFAGAWQMWSPSMQSRYPAQVYIYQRFAGTTSIRATRDALVSESGDRATVAVTVVEIGSSGSRTWVGTWQLVRINGVWLLDQPNLAAAG
jgi:hypothetical protein